MDQTGEDIQAGIPPDLIPKADTDRPLSEDVVESTGPDIDVPFTPAAQRVIERCAEMADLVGGDAILTEHLMLAIASTPECAAAKLIAEHNLSSENMLSALQLVLGPETRAVAQGQPNPRLERIIIRAKREAFRHGHAEASTLHLMMALIRERTSAPSSGRGRASGAYQRIAAASRRSAIATDSD
jgi:ATP-dependent Clp protease ATP-binding subunit ClpA